MTEHQKHQSNSPLSVNRVLENIIKSSGLITQNISAKKRAVSLMQHNDENPCRCGFFPRWVQSYMLLLLYESFQNANQRIRRIILIPPLGAHTPYQWEP